MQTQTPIKTYTAKRLANAQCSLVDEKGEVKPLLTGKELRLEVDSLELYPDVLIKAEYKLKWYGFRYDLTPIALEIEGNQVTAFDCLLLWPDGSILAEHEDKWYDFSLAGATTPMPLP